MPTVNADASAMHSSRYGCIPIPHLKLSTLQPPSLHIHAIIDRQPLMRMSARPLSTHPLPPPSRSCT
eukprot:3919854-Rhodomonas_salina.1